MKKLSLRLDDLQVTSFSTSPGRNPGEGTVFGRAATESPCNFTDATCYGAGCGSDGYSACAGCSNYDTCNGCEASLDGGSLCGGGTGGTIGVHCGPQGTMNPLWSQCVDTSMAGPTCDGGSTCAVTCGC